MQEKWASVMPSHRNCSLGFSVGWKQRNAGDDPQPKHSEAKCLAAAVRALATREYSVLELKTKLTGRFGEENAARVVSELKEQGLVDDARYAEAYCRNRIQRGYGPIFIFRALQQNGLDKELIETFLEPHRELWVSYASAQVSKKVGNAGSSNTLFIHSTESLENFGQLAQAAEGLIADSDWDEPKSAKQRREEWQASQKERARLAGFLARRGFSSTDAIKAIAKALDEDGLRARTSL